MRVIAGSARRLNLKTVPGMDTRPTTDRIKETLFNMLQDEVPGSRFLDLFAGSGAIGIEALSRGASEAVFVERDRRACQCIRDNLQFTRLADRGRLIAADVFSAVDRLDGQGKFDLIFMDPPYNKLLERDVLEKLKDTRLIGADTLLIVEASLETEFAYCADLGYDVVKQKRYKTNQHIFLMKR